MHCTLPKNIFKSINELFEIEKGTCSVELTFLVNGTSNGDSGELTSPGFPSNYPDNVNYTWILGTSHLNANVTFTILDSDISEPYFPPCDDYLRIITGQKNDVTLSNSLLHEVQPPQSNKCNVNAS